MSQADHPASAGCRADCPSADLLIDLVENQLDIAERERVLAAVAACPSCAAALRATKAMHAEMAAMTAGAPESAPDTPPADSAPTRATGPRPRAAWLALAAILTGLAIAMPLLWNRPPPVELVRSVDAAVFPADRASLDVFPLHWRWPGAEQALSYRVRVYDQQGQELALFESDTAELRFAQRPPQLPAQGSLVWEVSAELPQGSVRIGSWRFEVVR